MTKPLKDILRDDNAVSYEPVHLRAGEVSDYYVDIKKEYGNPEILAEIVRAIVEGVDTRTTCFAAAGYGGLALAILASQYTKLPLTMVRDVEKNHGRRGMVDGYVPSKDDLVTVLDDVFTSGSSLRQTIGTIRDSGAEVVGCHVVVARGDPNSFELPLGYLFTPEDLR